MYKRKGGGTTSRPSESICSWQTENLRPSGWQILTNSVDTLSLLPDVTLAVEIELGT